MFFQLFLSVLVILCASAQDVVQDVKLDNKEVRCLGKLTSKFPQTSSFQRFLNLCSM